MFWIKDVVQFFSLHSPSDEKELNFISIALEKKRQFFEVLYAGNVTLLCRRIKKIQKGNTGEAYNGNVKKEDEFISAPKYYIQFKDNLPLSFARGEKDIIKKFPLIETELRSFFKTTKKDLLVDSNLIEVFQFINTQLDKDASK